MECPKCGNQLIATVGFCGRCGFDLKQVNNQNEKTGNQGTSEENLTFPLDLMKCTEIRIEGQDTIFTDQTGKCIVSAVKTSGGIFKSNSFEYTAFDRNGNPYTFMQSGVQKGDSGFTQTAYDMNNEPIGNANYNGGLQSMAKTIIRIKDAHEKQYVLEEKVGLLKGFMKVISPPDHGIGLIASARTGKMEIKREDMTIGFIDSIRGSLFNTYRVLDCQNLRKNIDLRLVILGLTVKTLHTK